MVDLRRLTRGLTLKDRQRWMHWHPMWILTADAADMPLQSHRSTAVFLFKTAGPPSSSVVRAEAFLPLRVLLTEPLIKWHNSGDKQGAKRKMAIDFSNSAKRWSKRLAAVEHITATGSAKHPSAAASMRIITVLCYRFHIKPWSKASPPHCLVKYALFLGITRPIMNRGHKHKMDISSTIAKL